MGRTHDYMGRNHRLSKPAGPRINRSFPRNYWLRGFLRANFFVCGPITTQFCFPGGASADRSKREFAYPTAETSNQGRSRVCFPRRASKRKQTEANAKQVTEPVTETDTDTDTDTGPYDDDDDPLPPAGPPRRRGEGSRSSSSSAGKGWKKFF